MEGDPLRRVEQLERDVARLESEVAALRVRAETRPSPVSPSTFAWPPPAPAMRGPPEWPAPSVGGARTAKAAAGWSVESEAVLKWGGVGLVVLAVGFAVSTAISRHWIGPELQLAGALAVGGGLIGGGIRLRASRPAWTHALCSGGTIALFTTVASDLFLDQVPAGAALASTAAIGLATLALARSIRSEWVAGASLLGGTIGWAVIADRDFVFFAALAWFATLVGLVILVSVEREWYAARVSAEVVGMIAFLVLAGETATLQQQTWGGIAATAFAGTLFVVPSIGDLSSTWQRIELQLAVVASPWMFMVSVAVGLESRPDDVIALGALAIAVATLCLARALRSRLQRVHSISLVIGASVTISIGLAILLSTTAVFVALAVQAAGLVMISRALERDVRLLVNAIVLASISVIFAVDRMCTAWEQDLPIGDDVGHLLVIGAIGSGIWLHGGRITRRVGAVAVLALVLVWLGSALVHLPQGQAVVSVSWATVGTVVLLLGVIGRRTDAAATGLAVLAITVAKLLTVDLREVDTLWRAGLFFVIGVGLMRLGFLLPHLARPEPDADAAAGPTDRQIAVDPTGRDL